MPFGLPPLSSGRAAPLQATAVGGREGGHVPPSPVQPTPPSPPLLGRRKEYFPHGFYGQWPPELPEDQKPKPPAAALVDVP